MYLQPALILCILIPQIYLLQDGRPTPQIGRTLSTCLLETTRDKESLVLVERKSKRPHAKQGHIFLYRIYEVRDDTLSNIPKRRKLIDLPDIPTHDRMGAPPTIRSGGLLWDVNSDQLFIVTAKSIGASIIIRLHTILGAEFRNNMELTTESVQLLGIMEHHEDELEGPITSISLEIYDGVLHIQSRRSQEDVVFREFNYDLKTKKISKSKSGSK